MTHPLIVLGSANRDYVVTAERHPQPGETVLGGALTTGTGGKGANQAVAAARAGAAPILIAAVGDDASGSQVLADLAAAGVDVSRVVVSATPTGAALITVADGDNTIVVAPGANSTLDPEAVRALVTELVSHETVLLAQFEIPVDVLSAAAEAVAAAHGRFVVNLSPLHSAYSIILSTADPIILNESESSALAGATIDGPADAEVVAERLLATSRSVVITLGGDGAVVADGRGVIHIPAPSVPVVDTTGAGDAFAGSLAAALAQGLDLRAAAERGVLAGSEAVQHVGAQRPPSDPT